MSESFFSVSIELVPTGKGLPYDLFINSSIVEKREKFVRIVRMGDNLTKDDLTRYKGKYHQLYVKEEQRSQFLKGMALLTPEDYAVNKSPKQQSEEGSKSTEPKPITISPVDIAKSTVLKESAIHHLQTLFDSEDLPTEVLTQTIVGCRDVVEGMIDVLQDYSIDKLRELITNLSFHDFYTYDHSINVSMYNILIYKTLNAKATHAEILLAGLGGLLHDLGKIKIPTHIINNTGKLSDEDFNEIKKHPGFGHDLLLQQADSLPKDIHPGILARIINEHHENFDGTGYPNKVPGDGIHLLARITSIADFFDAITTKRSYHEPLSIEDAIVLMRKFEGKKIDPKLFQLFLTTAKEIAIKKGNPHLKFTTEDFDPCQPHAQLPVTVENKAEAPAEKPKDFGQVKIVEGGPPPTKSKDFGKVTIIGGDTKDTTPAGTAFRKKKSA